MATTRSRPRGREHARPSTGGVTTEHAAKIYTVVIVGIVVIVAVLALTSIGHTIDAATQHFMLFYAGVFALMALCTSVAFGLVSTDRMILHPGQRVFIQSAHRAASFGAVAFLIIHVVTEILAQRVHVIDAFVPFLSPFKTFYIGLGTIAGDIFILLAITGIMRGRFNSNGKAWRWRAIHYSSYVAFIFGIWHGLLGGRPAKPYYDWTYGVIVALALLGLAVRVLSNSLRPRENLSAPPVDQSASSASAPLRAAAMLSQYGGGMRSGRTALGGGPTGAQPVLSAPVTAPVMTALPAAAASSASQGQPFYEPGYDGPPRYLGAPRSADSGPMPAATGSMPRVTGSMPRATGSMPRATGSMPAATGSYPAAAGHMNSGGSGHVTVPNATTPMPRPGSGPQQMPTGSGAYPAMPTGSGAYPTMPSGSGAYPTMPTGSGAYPTMSSGSGAYPTMPTGPQSWPGSAPRAGDGRPGDWESGPRSRPSSSGPAAGGAGPRGASGAWPRPNGSASGPYQRPPTQSMPRGGHPSGSFPAMPSPYPDGAGGGRPDAQGWPNVGNDGSWYPEEQQWDAGFPGSDPNLRYREPGPGMPGYRGSREHRYGGDRY